MKTEFRKVYKDLYVGGEKTKYYGGCILSPEYIKQPHECYDRYNGKNLK